MLHDFLDVGDVHDVVAILSQAHEEKPAPAS